MPRKRTDDCVFRQILRGPPRACSTMRRGQIRMICRRRGKLLHTLMLHSRCHFALCSGPVSLISRPELWGTDRPHCIFDLNAARVGALGSPRMLNDSSSDARRRRPGWSSRQPPEAHRRPHPRFPSGPCRSAYGLDVARVGALDSPRKLSVLAEERKLHIARGWAHDSPPDAR